MDAPAYSDQLAGLQISVIAPVDASDITNGCLEVAVGAHQRGVLPHTGPNGSILDDVMRDWQWAPLKLGVGDIAVFGSLLPHRSGPNTTATSRRAYYITFNPLRDGDRHAVYYDDKRKYFPPDAEREQGKDYSEGAKTYNLANPIRHFP